MCERVEDLVAGLRRAVASDDAGSDPASMVELFAEAERLCAAGRTTWAGRAARSNEWRDLGYRTPAQWVASRVQSTVGSAIATLETARRLEELPATRGAFVAGRLSEVQASEIAAAAAADPGAEGSLLASAAQDTVAQLKEQCRHVRAAAAGDEDSVERIRLGRYLRNWIDRDGAMRLEGRFAPDDGGRLMVVVDAAAARIQSEARRSGQKERAEAYKADALVALAGGTVAPKAVVHVQVDASALDRGRTIAGEVCAIAGIGPVPVATAKRFAADGVIKVVERKGRDVRRIAHLGRTIPAHLRSALEARDPICVVPGCDVRTGLEIDHLVPFADGGPTRLDNLARVCRYHHAQKTHHGWRLGGAPGRWTWSRGHSKRAWGRAPPPRPP